MFFTFTSLKATRTDISMYVTHPSVSAASKNEGKQACGQRSHGVRGGDRLIQKDDGSENVVKSNPSMISAILYPLCGGRAGEGGDGCHVKVGLHALNEMLFGCADFADAACLRRFSCCGSL